MPICYPEVRCLIMDAYADYEFYIVNYRGKAVSETDFPVAALNASQFIRMLTVGRSDRYEGDEIKYAICAAAEAYAQAFRLSESESGIAEISTENTDATVSHMSIRDSQERHRKPCLSERPMMLSEHGFLVQDCLTGAAAS